MAEATDNYAFNPDDPQERQGLEVHLQADTEMLHETHSTLEAERHYTAALDKDGYPKHTGTDDRINGLEDTEQWFAKKVVSDQQDIDHWDHAHPGWNQQPDGSTNGDASTEDPYAGYEDSADASASYDDASTGDPYAGDDGSSDASPSD